MIPTGRRRRGLVGAAAAVLLLAATFGPAVWLASSDDEGRSRLGFALVNVLVALVVGLIPALLFVVARRDVGTRAAFLDVLTRVPPVVLVPYFLLLAVTPAALYTPVGAVVFVVLGAGAYGFAAIRKRSRIRRGLSPFVWDPKTRTAKAPAG